MDRRSIGNFRLEGFFDCLQLTEVVSTADAMR
jgi:hypothetical protein